MERRLAAILSADIVGYSRLIADDEARTLTALREFRRGVVADALSYYNGQIIKSMGDGWLLEFDSISHAVACAQSIQQALKEHERLSLRIGVHLGDIAIDDDDIFGDGVNIAARLQAIAPGGSVLISQDVQRQLDGQARSSFAAVGVRRLKNIDKEVDLYVWPPDAVDTLADPDADRGSGIPRLLVGPFTAAGDGDEEALAYGIGEQLSDALRSMRNFSIVVRPEDANYVLRGTLRSSGSRRRLQVQLDYIPKHDRFWSRHFDFEGADVFEAQDFFAKKLYQNVRGKLNDYDGRLVDEKSVHALTVEELLSLSAHKFMRNDLPTWREIPALMDRALAMEPDNSSALARWALAALGDYYWGYRKVPQDLRQRAIAYADRAQQLDPQSGFVHLAKAQLSLFFDSAHDDALITADRALAINPNLGLARNVRGQVLVLGGRCEDGLAQMPAVADLDPEGAFLCGFLQTYALGNFGLTDYGAAADFYRQADRASPNLPAVLAGWAASLWHNGELDAARTTAQRLLANNQEFRLSDAHLPPWRDRETMLRYVEGLRGSGLPE